MSSRGKFHGFLARPHVSFRAPHCGAERRLQVLVPLSIDIDAPGKLKSFMG
jgi:hypothetical protein